jgi:hypothetical protein
MGHITQSGPDYHARVKGEIQLQQLTRVFADYAEDSRFQNWIAGVAQQFRFVYACEYGTIWKFTPKEWWQFVAKTVRNDGAYDLPLSKALGNRPRHITPGDDGRLQSSDCTVRCINLTEWNVSDWQNELSEN